MTFTQTPSGLHVPDRSLEYAAGTRGDHFAWWCETYCVQTIDQFAGLPLELEPFQLEFLYEALAVNADGSPYWTSVLLILPRKNGKSVLLAAFALYRADTEDGSPEILLAAASDKQADRMFGYAADFVRASPYLDDGFHLRDYVGEIARADGGATIYRMSSNPKTIHGYNPSLVVADELAQWTTPTLRKAWAGLTTGGGARRQAQSFAITTEADAEEREASVLGRIVDANEACDDVERPHDALTISRNHEARTLVYRFSAPIRSRRAPVREVKKANPASWITEEYLGRQQANPELEDADFLQLHACVTASRRSSYISLEDWRDRQTGEGVPAGERPPRRVSLGIDGSHTYDTTVVAWASRAPDGMLDVDCRIYSVRLDAPHHVHHEGGRIIMSEVEDDVVELFGLYNVRQAGFDPRYLNRSAEILDVRLPEAKLIHVEPTSKHMRDALAAFHRAVVVDKSVRVRPDRMIAAHVGATKGERDERGWKVNKRRASRPIDAVPAMAIAVWLEEKSTKRSPYARRGLRVIGGGG
ncbi:MAG: terminase large subunit [Solirubrobacteraceae bacterium]